MQNRPYATSQVKDLAEKLEDAIKDGEKHSAHLTFNPIVSEKAAKSKRKQASVEGYTVEDSDTPTSKAAQEG